MEFRQNQLLRPIGRHSYDAIRLMRSKVSAPVDTMGCQAFGDMQQDPKMARFHVLISLMLSAQTKDTITAIAMKRLKDYGLTVPSMMTISEPQLDELIRMVGFHNRKAK